MAGGYFIVDVRARATFAADRMTKQDCFRSERLFAGLNCLARGQTQPSHTHDAVDKFYLVLSGKARIAIGTGQQELGEGGMAWAPAGVPHGIDEALEDSVILVTMAPSPRDREEGKGMREE